MQSKVLHYKEPGNGIKTRKRQPRLTSRDPRWDVQKGTWNSSEERSELIMDAVVGNRQYQK
jgi:hypothetical protein